MFVWIWTFHGVDQADVTPLINDTSLKTLFNAKFAWWVTATNRFILLLTHLKIRHHAHAYKQVCEPLPYNHPTEPNLICKSAAERRTTTRTTTTVAVDSIRFSSWRPTRVNGSSFPTSRPITWERALTSNENNSSSVEEDHTAPEFQKRWIVATHANELNVVVGWNEQNKQISGFCSSR